MRTFLSAEWLDLVMVNYEVDQKLLHHFVPPGTVLDSFDGRTYISLVGFQFRRTSLFGALPVPFHRDFDEINLRFYVRHKEGNEDRRGVVFIAEIVPKWAIAKVARIVYGENYIRLPMKHHVDKSGATITAEYEWQQGGAWSKIYEGIWQSRARRRRQPRAIHHRALLGLFEAAKRWLAGISRRACALECLAEHRGRI